MLNPRVGLILLMSSPFSFLRIVVFPALSRPLRVISLDECILAMIGDLQEEQTHLLLLLPVLSDDCEQAHSICRVTVVEGEGDSSRKGQSQSRLF
jgi:hypothetical protein